MIFIQVIIDSRDLRLQKVPKRVIEDQYRAYNKCLIAVDFPTP